MIYLHEFETTSEFETQYNGGGYLEPWVSLTKENDDVNYNKKKYEPLTFSILSDGEIGWKIGSGSAGRTIQYSKNGGEWTDITSTTGGTAIHVVTGDVLRFKGDTWPGNLSNYSQFTSTCTFAASGNPGSLKYGEVTYGDEPLADYCYDHMFCDCTGLTSAPALPATTLAVRCYYYMFRGCTSLTSAPELPAITLESSCYEYMFGYCTNLTTAPALSATTLADGCYQYMFYGCTSLATAPSVLPATTLADYCYDYMFCDCTGLTSAPALPATTLAVRCYYYMFRGCTSLATAPSVLPATTLASNCYDHMFADCTSLTTAPALPATTLANECCRSMFQGCTSLASAPALPATTLASKCYMAMFYGCTKITSAPELPATTLADNCYGLMFYNCSKLNYVRCLATDISASSALSIWLSGVSSTGTFYKAAGVTYPSGASGIPAGWTVVEV